MLYWLILTVIFFLIVKFISKYFSGTLYMGSKGDLTGKIAIITGGNSGIGKQTTLCLAQQGCTVIIGARDIKKSEMVVQEINSLIGKERIKQYALDLSDLESVREFVEQIKEEQIDFLINNAGSMGAPKRTLSKAGFQMQYSVNYLGHFYLTHLLWAKLNKSQFFRVINISSLAHKRQVGFLGATKLNWEDMHFEKQKYNSNTAYSRSKLYNNLFTHCLAQKIQKQKCKGIALSLHPGVVRTQIAKNLLGGHIVKIQYLFHPLYTIVTKSTLQGAQTTLCLVFTPVQNLKNGGYYSDCYLASQSNLVIKQNWDKLWHISQKDLQISFGCYN